MLLYCPRRSLLVEALKFVGRSHCDARIGVELLQAGYGGQIPLEPCGKELRSQSNLGLALIPHSIRPLPAMNFREDGHAPVNRSDKGEAVREQVCLSAGRHG